MSVAPIADARVLRGAAATITGEIVDQEGEPTDPDGDVTVDITRADGTVIDTGRATAQPVDEDSDPIVGTYTVDLTADELATLDTLTLVWNDDGTARVTSIVDVVGGYFFSLRQIRGFDSSLTDTSKYPDATLLQARHEVEVECERITGCAWVPRYRRARIEQWGDTDHLRLPDPAVRSVRSVRSYWNGTDFLALTDTELEQIVTTDAGEVTRVDGGVFPGGITNGVAQIVVEYEHGRDRPPPDLVHAALTHLRHVVNREGSGIRSNVTQMVQQGGTTMTMALPGRAGFETGIPEVDAVYLRPGINMRTPGIA